MLRKMHIHFPPRNPDNIESIFNFRGQPQDAEKLCLRSLLSPEGRSQGAVCGKLSLVSHDATCSQSFPWIVRDVIVSPGAVFSALYLYMLHAGGLTCVR